MTFMKVRADGPETACLKAVIESLTHPFYIIDAATYELVVANSHTPAQTGALPNTCYGRTHRCSHPCQESDGHSCPLELVRASGKAVVVEHVHIDDQGRERLVEVHGFPIFDEAGKLVQMVEYSLDITDRRNLENERRHALDTMQSALKLRSVFLATMSHEFRTPLNGILGMTYLLGSTELTGEQREYLDTIRHCGDTLLALVNNILDFSMLESGAAPLREELVAPRDLVADTLKGVGALRMGKDIELLQRVDPDVPAAVYTDRTRLRQILWNLAGNAIKFTARGQVVIDLAAAPAPDSPDHVTLVLRVRDSGCGIPEDMVEAVFGEFVQASSGPSRRFGGAGLGLAIVRRLAVALGGSARVETTSPSGTTVRVDLNVRVAVPAPPDDAGT